MQARRITAADQTIAADLSRGLAVRDTYFIFAA
jgi:hypothetical protein